MSKKKKDNAKIEEVAEEYSVDIRTVNDWIKAGIDIENPIEVEMYQASLGENNNEDSLLEDSAPATKEEFFNLKLKKLRHETSIKESEAQMKSIELQKRRGEMISIEEATDQMMVISTKVKSQLRSLIVKLPPKLIGLDIKDMANLLEEELNDILQYLHKELNIDE